jgi:predicted MFS family arabinose efflux permease
MLGPALTGVLVQAITAPLAILLDAASFLASTVSVWAIRTTEPAPDQNRDIPLLEEAFDGMRFIWNQPALRALLLRSATAFLSLGVISPLYLLSAIRIVHMSTSALGLAIALGGAGALVGAWLAAHLSHRLGHGPTFFATAILVGCAQLLIPMSAHYARFGFAFLCVQQFGGDLCWTIYIVNETTIRQTLAPRTVMGRVNSAMQLASRGMLPFGAIAGGLLAQRFGIPFTLWIGASGVLLSCIWPVPPRTARSIEPQQT